MVIVMEFMENNLKSHKIEENNYKELMILSRRLLAPIRNNSGVSHSFPRTSSISAT